MSIVSSKINVLYNGYLMLFWLVAGEVLPQNRHQQALIRHSQLLRHLVSTVAESAAAGQYHMVLVVETALTSRN